MSRQVAAASLYLVVSVADAVMSPRFGNEQLLQVLGSTTWAVCSHDWAGESYIERPGREWSYLPGLQSTTIDRFREKCLTQPPKQHVNDKEKRLDLLRVLNYTSHMLNHDLAIPWYLSAGSFVGQLRSQTLIPWDSDIDIAVPKAHRNKIRELVERTPRFSCTVEDAEGLARVSWDSENSIAVATVSSWDQQYLFKALWFDPFSNATVDGCFDCPNPMTGWQTDQLAEIAPAFLNGNIPIKVPKNVWETGEGLEGVGGVDLSTKTIKMSTGPVRLKTGGFGDWQCKKYTCDTQPELLESAQGAESHGQYLAKDADNFLQDSFFQVVGEVGHCSRPVNLDACHASDFTEKTIDVGECI